MSRRETGARGENIAVSYLEKKGYRIRDRNYRCRAGEVDIVAENAGYLVFVEVRTKKDISFGSPEESITAAKKKRMVAVAQTYIDTHSGLPSNWRIDVVAIQLDDKGKVSQIRLVKNATA